MIRYCDHRGLLVDGSARLPSDLSDFWHEPMLALTGCNRLRCGKCGAWVTSMLGEDGRTYKCDCRSWLAERVDRLENDHESPSDPDLPWACAGHESPTLPLTLNGLSVGSDWPGLVAKILGGACPRPLELPRREGPSLWLGWLYVYLGGLPEADALSEAIGERVDDPDPAVVGSALFFFQRFPRAKGAERAVARAAAAADGVAVGYLIPDTYVPTLWDVLMARLEAHIGDQQAETVVKQVMVTPLSSLSHADVGQAQWVNPLYKSLRKDVVVDGLERTQGAFDDPDLRLWLTDHIVQINAAAPGRWKNVMGRLSDWFDKPELGHLIVIAGTAIIQSGAVSPDELEAWIEWRRENHGWMDDAWILPLQTVIEDQRRKSTAN